MMKGFIYSYDHSYKSKTIMFVVDKSRIHGLCMVEMMNQ
jgi:hypothetical protein